MLIDRLKALLSSDISLRSPRVRKYLQRFRRHSFKVNPVLAYPA